MKYNNCDKKNPESKIKNRDNSRIMILWGGVETLTLIVLTKIVDVGRE